MFVKTNNGYFSVVKIHGIDIFHYKSSDQETVYYNYAHAETSCKLPHKYVFMDGSPVLSEQKNYVLYRLKNTTHPYCRFLLEREIERFETLEQHQRDRLAYLFIFGKNMDEVRKAAKNYIADMKDTTSEICVNNELVHILSKLLTFRQEKSNNHIYKNFLHSILPNGLKLSGSYFQAGKKYVTTLVAYKFPSYMSDLLFANLFSCADVTVTLDVSFKPKTEIKKELKQSMKELESREVIERSSSDMQENSYEYQDLQELYTFIDRGNEQIVSTTLRFYISADSVEALKNSVINFSKMLEDNGIDVMTPANEMEQEYKALTKPADIIGQPIPLYETYSRQYPYYFQNLVDEGGTYAGQTTTGGHVILNTFKKTKERVSYDALLIGIKGSGKSATLKAMIQNILSLGHKAFILDVDREYGEFAKMLGGKVIRLNKDSMINALELHRTIIDGVSEDEDVANNFPTEISRIETFLYQYIPSLNDMEAEEFKSVLQAVYAEKNINADTDLTKLKPQDFPIFSDVLTQIRKRLYSHYTDENNNEFNSKLSDRKRNIYEQLESYIRQFAEGIYSSLFNGYSSIDINNENLVIFDVKDLSEMGDRVYNAQLFNILSLMWNEVCNNRIQNQYIDREWDRTYIACVIDEAHRFINSKNPAALNFIEKLTRRARKYDAGLWFASQSILDFMPKDSRENSDMIKTIFSLVQYKMIMKQTDSSLDTLLEVFPQFTESELASTALFKAGETLLSLGGGREKIRFTRYIPDNDFAYFGGGREESKKKDTQ